MVSTNQLIKKRKKNDLEYFLLAASAQNHLYPCSSYSIDKNQYVQITRSKRAGKWGLLTCSERKVKYEFVRHLASLYRIYLSNSQVCISLFSYKDPLIPSPKQTTQSPIQGCVHVNGQDCQVKHSPLHQAWFSSSLSAVQWLPPPHPMM